MLFSAKVFQINNSFNKQINKSRLSLFVCIFLSISIFIIACGPEKKSEKIQRDELDFSINHKNKPKNIFLIIVDTLRADRLSCYGYQSHQTPAIDSIAQDGILFSRAMSVASWTRPSIGSILTSMYPRQLGLIEKPSEGGKIYAPREKREELRRRIPDTVPTLAQILSESGYMTAAFVNQPALNQNISYGKGFTSYFYPVSADRIQKRKNKEDVFPQSWDFTNEAFRVDTLLAEEFGGWLKDNGNRPVFAWIHILTPHMPYCPPERYMPANPCSDVISEASALYDGEIRAADSIVGKIISYIKNYAGLQDSLIILASDHGEEFMDHGLLEHGHSLHAEVTHIPLILSYPGVLPHCRIENNVRTIDILPTVLDIASVKYPDSSCFEGTSLMCLLEDKNISLDVFQEGVLYGGTKRSFTQGDYKLIIDFQDNVPLFYNIKQDPAETNNIAQDYPDSVKLYSGFIDKRTKRLQIFYDNISAEFISDERSDNCREDSLDALRSLGYID